MYVCQNKSASEIGRTYGVSYAAIINYLKDNGISIRKKSKPRESLLERYAEGI
jgi:hypothetical protein